MSEHEVEADRIPGRAVGATLVGVVVAIVLAALIVTGLTGGEHEGERGGLTHDVSGLETSAFTVEAQGINDRTAVEQRLRTYGWVDRQRRIVHVPLDVAIDALLREHPQVGATR